MSFALTLDTLAERYSLLPSQVLRSADTLDLWVMDVALAYHDVKNKKANGKAGYEIDVPEMQKMLEETRAARKQNNG